MGSIGIDFGTSTTVVAFVERGEGRLVRDPASDLVRDSCDEDVFPSYVSFTPNGQVKTGRLAKARRGMDPDNTVHSFKRIIGFPWNSPQVTEFRRWYPGKLNCDSKNTPRFETRSGSLTALEIASYFLASLREHDPIRTAARQGVCLTLPISFGESQANAIREAAQRAGFEDVELINEAYAAALPYAARATQDRLIAVYDLGGGTFDFALLHCDGRSHEVLAAGGDPYLGGDDIDARLADWVADEALAQHHWDLRADSTSFKNLVWACEDVKVRLSGVEQFELHLGLVDPALARRTIVVDRTYLDKILYELVQRTFVVCDNTISDAGFSADRVDTVVLAGGGSYIPYVRRATREYFGREPETGLPPDRLVAIGAQMLGDPDNQPAWLKYR